MQHDLQDHYPIHRQSFFAILGCFTLLFQASRYVTKCRCGTEPVWHRGTGENTAFARISIHGQSFMLHQIRKMIALAILLFTERVPPDSIRKSFDSSVLVNIPPAPAAGLFVDSILFDAVSLFCFSHSRRYMPLIVVCLDRHE